MVQIIRKPALGAGRAHPIGEGGEELVALVRGLEHQYDAVAGAESRGNLVAEPAELPSADELGAEFERFLAEREGDGGA